MAKAVAKKRRSDLAKRANELRVAINDELKLENGLSFGSDPYFTITRVPTGSLVMDRITGGGLAHGRHYEFYGDESAGKSYILYTAMVLSQQRGNLCAMIDPEHSFDEERFTFLGGRPEELLIQHPNNAEEAVAVMMLMAKNAADIEIIGIDSVSSLVAREEMENDPRQEDRMGSQARMMSRALRRITTVNKKTIFIWTNQERENIGIRFGNPKTTSGGKALRFYATGRIEFRKGTKVMGKVKRAKAGKLVETEAPIGRWTQVRVEKDKSTIPGREGAFVFNYNMKRIDPASEIIQLGLEDGLIERSANGRYAYTDLEDKEWKGTEKQFGKLIRQNADLYDELRSAIEITTRTMNVVEQGGDEDSESDD